jgi:putative ABC transport system permease protein
MADVRLAIRTLLQARGFTAAAVFTLAAGFGLATAAMSVLNAYLIRGLPYPASSRLYNISYAPPGQQQPPDLHVLDWTSVSDVIEHPIAWDLDMFYLIGDNHPEQAAGAWVTQDFMRGFGVQVQMGRTFQAEDHQPGAPQVALVSHAFWQSRFGGDPAILGKRFEAYLSDRPDEAEVFTIIGVLPANFWHFNPYTNVFAPLRGPTYPYIARLRDGISSGDAEIRISNLIRDGNASLPRDYQVRLQSAHASYVRSVQPMLYAVGAAAGIVLMIASANVAFLVLMRSTRRQKEAGMRLALGAGRMRIAQMLVAESLVLSAVAVTLGLLMSSLVLRSLAPVLQQQLGRPAPGGSVAFSIDLTVLLVIGAVGLATAFVLALTPLAALRGDLAGILRRGRQGGADTVSSRRMRSVLVMLEIAGTLALVAGGGLMIRTTRSMLSVDFGIQADHVMAAPLALRDRNYPDDASLLAFYDRFLTGLTESPGIESAAFAGWPVHAEPQAQPIRLESNGSSVVVRAGVIPAGPGYFELFGVPLTRGRLFDTSDRYGAGPVAIVSETLAGHVSQTGSVIGGRLRIDEDDVRTIIGVVEDIRQGASDVNQADIYVPMFQSPRRFTTLYLKGAAGAPALTESARTVLKQMDPEASLGAMRLLETVIADQFIRPRFLASLLTGFAFSALAISLIGVYGVVAYSVRQREHEIAVRIALGAGPDMVAKMFIGEGVRIIVPGLAAGILGAIALGRMLESQLHGVRPADPWTLTATAVIIATTSAFAAWRPARIAARTDPVLSLKEQ